MGSHSGYDPLFDVIPRLRPGHYRSIHVRAELPAILQARTVLGWLRRRAGGSPFYNERSMQAELELLLHHRRVDLMHLSYVENQLGWLARAKGLLRGALVGTVHQPPGWYQQRFPDARGLARLDAIIALGSRQAEWFDRHAPGRVSFVRHGVDLDFFRPAPRDEQPTALRCLFGGKWLRDFETLSAVVTRVLARHREVQFDLLIPREAQCHRDLRALVGHDRVHWYAELSDVDLREKYRRASLVVLPMEDSVGNNVLVESLACGVPVVTNRVGAMPDYVRPDFGELLAPRDVVGMTDAVLDLLVESGEREQRAKAARAFAEAELSWERCARDTLAVYDRVLGRGPEVP